MSRGQVMLYAVVNNVKQMKRVANDNSPRSATEVATFQRYVLNVLTVQ